MITQKIGREAELMASEWLQKQGLILITRNFNCKSGEIDLIMRDKEYLVFVEVRARNNKNYGGSLLSVGYSKQQKIIRAANYYLLINQLHERYPLRFDIFTIDGITTEWIKNAFGMEY